MVTRLRRASETTKPCSRRLRSGPYGGARDLCGTPRRHWFQLTPKLKSAGGFKRRKRRRAAMASSSPRKCEKTVKNHHEMRAVYRPTRPKILGGFLRYRASKACEQFLITKKATESHEMAAILLLKRWDSRLPNCLPNRLPNRLPNNCLIIA